MVRKLQQSDWEQYKRLRLLSLQTNPDVYFSSYDEVSRWPDGNFKSEIYAHPESPFGYCGYFEGERLVGYISLAESYFEKQKHTADVFNLFVDPEYRGSGIARSLVDALLENAKNTGRVEKLFLSVMSQNTPALSLYRSVGFQEYGQKRHSLKVGSDYFDETLMECVL